MAGDGKINGQFFIEKGQGLSQAIRDELGLEQTDADKLGSVWTKIFEQVNKQQEENINAGKAKIYNKGNNLAGKTSENYVVYENQAVSFSKAVWDEIVRLVNEMLGKNITSVQQEENFGATSAQNTGTEEVSQENKGTQGAQSAQGDQAVQDEQVKTEADSVKVNVTESIEQQAQVLAQELKDELTSNRVNIKNAEKLLKKITPDNVAFILEVYPNLPTDIDKVFRMGAGFDKKDVHKYVLEPMIKKYEELGSSMKYYDGVEITVENSKNLSLAAMKQKISSFKDELLGLVKEDGFSKIQQTFDDANQFLAEVANMDPKPKIKSGKNTEKNYEWKEAELDDGRWIQVRYNSEGEISEILISHDTTPNKSDDGTTYDAADIKYTQEKARYDTDHNNGKYEGSITSGYDFEKLKALAEKIFGKKEAEE